MDHKDSVKLMQEEQRIIVNNGFAKREKVVQQSIDVFNCLKDYILGQRDFLLHNYERSPIKEKLGDQLTQSHGALLYKTENKELIDYVIQNYPSLKHYNAHYTHSFLDLTGVEIVFPFTRSEKWLYVNILYETDLVTSRNGVYTPDKYLHTEMSDSMLNMVNNYIGLLALVYKNLHEGITGCFSDEPAELDTDKLMKLLGK